MSASTSTPQMAASPIESVLQFGTGKFLRAFADLFVEELNRSEKPLGRVVVVQSTDSGLGGRLNDVRGRYHVAIRGLQAGASVDRMVKVTSVGRALIARSQWPEVLAVARSIHLSTILSNTTEAGYALDPLDRPDDGPPRSFPAKLLALLRARFEAGGSALTILPCELLDDNAARLREAVLAVAAQWDCPGDLVQWIQQACIWRNTLVDRIVSAPKTDDPMAEDPLFAVAEPFAQWLIEGQGRLGGLERHPAVRCVDRLEPYRLRKVRLLNGAHTALVAKALPRGIETVREAVADTQVGPWLRTLMRTELAAAIEDRVEDPLDFCEQVLERFANPFLDHRLRDIALHHETKIQTRLMPTVEDYRRRFGRTPPMLGELLGLE